MWKQDRICLQNFKGVYLLIVSATLLLKGQCFAGSEDFYTTIYAYYGVTVFSFRNMMAPLLRKKPELKQRMWPRANDFHPSCVGTRSVFQNTAQWLTSHEFLDADSCALVSLATEIAE